MSFLTEPSIPIRWQVESPVKISPPSIVAVCEKQCSKRVTIVPRSGAALPGFNLVLKMSNAKMQIIEKSESKYVIEVNVQKTNPSATVDTGYVEIRYNEDTYFPNEKLSIAAIWKNSTSQENGVVN